MKELKEIKKFKKIKPNKHWVAFTREEILGREESFSVFSALVSPKLAYSAIIVPALLLGLFFLGNIPEETDIPVTETKKMEDIIASLEGEELREGLIAVDEQRRISLLRLPTLETRPTPAYE